MIHWDIGNDYQVMFLQPWAMGHVSIVIGHGTKVIGNGICETGLGPCLHSHGTRVTGLGYWVNG